MQSKRYASAATALGVIATFALAAPAFAASVNVPVNQEDQAEVSSGQHAGWDEGGEMRRAPGILGTVASVSGTTLTVTSKGPRGGDLSGAIGAPAPTTYTVDATNATVTKNNTASTLSAIATGDTVMVQGTVSGTNVTATTIRDLPARAGGWQGGMGPGKGGTPPSPVITGNGQPVVGGSVTAINGSTLTITNKGNVTYSVDATNATIEKGNATSTLASVAVGDSVIVQGTINGSSVTASSVMDQGAAPAAGSTAKPRGFMGFFSGIGGFFAHLFGF